MIIRKILTTALFMCLIGLNAAFSQVKWNVEVQTGVTELTSLPSNSSGKFLWAVGGGASIQLTDVVHIAPSLLFSQRGAKFDGYYGDEMIMAAKYSICTNYLELPVNLALHFGSKENLRFIIKTGPSFSYGLTGKMKVSGENSDFSMTYPENLFSEQCTMTGAYDSSNHALNTVPKFNRFDLQWGIGFDVMIKQHFIVGLNAKIGLTNVTPKPISDNVLGQLATLFLMGTANSRDYSAALSFAYQF
jgi:hypothetical protein